MFALSCCWRVSSRSSCHSQEQCGTWSNAVHGNAWQEYVAKSFIDRHILIGIGTYVLDRGSHIVPPFLTFSVALFGKHGENNATGINQSYVSLSIVSPGKLAWTLKGNFNWYSSVWQSPATISMLLQCYLFGFGRNLFLPSIIHWLPVIIYCHIKLVSMLPPIEKDISLNHSCVSPTMGCLVYT